VPEVIRHAQENYYDKLRESSPLNDMKRSLFSAPKIAPAFLRVSCGASVYMNISNFTVRMNHLKIETSLVPASNNLSRLPMRVELLDIGKKSCKLFVGKATPGDVELEFYMMNLIKIAR
jgi:hypothetical protein